MAALSDLARSAKFAVIDLEGKISRSEFYFTNLETNEELQLCVTPDIVRAQTETNFRTFNIIERGEIKIPKGERLTTLHWEGILPGVQILLYPNITKDAWEDPIELTKVFRRWRETGAKLHLLVTQTPFNLDVYIKNFNYEASGGLGDYKYQIDLIAAKDLKVMTVAEADEARENAKETTTDALNERAAMKSKAATQFTQITNLWGVAQMMTGQGSRWIELFDLDTDPTDIAIDAASDRGQIIWG